MGEEILSPTTPNASRSPPQHQIQLSQSGGGQGQPASGYQAYAPPKPTKGEWGTKQDKTSNKLRWQGLHVATSFSKSPTLAQKAAERNIKQEQGLALQGHGRPMPPSVETLALNHQQSKRSLKPSNSKGRIGDLTRASSKFSNLSPSDRAVVIGLSVSPEELDHHATSPEATPIEPKYVKEQRTLGRRPSIAPTITVTTPANEQAPWSAGDEEEAFHSRQRAASSVYSQVPPPYPDERFTNSSIIPPIPPLPLDARRHNAEVKRTMDRHARDEPSRVMSTYTVFEDEDTPVNPRGKDSRKSQLRVLTKQGSMDTLATRRRSQGWWNHIISPFFPKSPMTFKLPSSSPSHEQALADQDPLHAGKFDRDRELEKSSRPPYPESLKLHGPGSSHTSWTDSTLEAECEKGALNVDDSPNKNRGTLIIGQPPGLKLSPPPVGSEGFGAAAEYYEACLYDMHSPEPFFECQNHICLPRRTDPVTALQAGIGALSRGVDAGPNGIFGTAEDLHKEPPQLLAVDQTPKNRFSAAFHEGITPKSKARPESEATVIEELDTTPMIQEAHIAPIVRAPEPVPAAKPLLPREEAAQARVIEGPLPREEYPPPQSSVILSPEKETPRREKPAKRFIAVMPPDHTPAPYETRYGQPAEPEPISPGMQKHAPRDAIQMDEVRSKPIEPVMMPKTPITPWGNFNRDRDSYYQEADKEYKPPGQVTLADLYPPPKPSNRFKDSRTWEVWEKDLPAREKKSGKFSKCRNCFSTAKPKNKKEKRIMIAIATGLVLLIILILVLTMTLTRKSNNKMDVQSQWLNLTGFPPIPTGFSTIVQPQSVGAVSGCVEPQTMWSCAVPKEEQQGILPNQPNQPNFRVQILFQNGTNATTNATTGNASNVNTRSYGHIANAASAGRFIRHRVLDIRNLLGRNNPYTPDPAPPSTDDQTFLGNTTDQIVGSLDGYFTPFFISFVSATKLPSRLVKRASSSSSTNSSGQFPDTDSLIPPPDSNPNGTAAGANLYPYPTNQPLRLYNKGLDTEHYGFYTYFDRSIFLKSTAPLNASASNIAPVPDDNNGGSDENAASVRCTWAQTRFLVQMWTRKGKSASLLGASNTTNSLQNTNTTTITSSSANDFTQPGSFPYPITITIDRHGGDVNSKMIYCYGMDNQEHIDPSQKKIQTETRDFGGQLINPYTGPFGHTKITTAEGGPGGVDGGTGGCSCKWQNWETG